MKRIWATVLTLTLGLAAAMAPMRADADGLLEPLKNVPADMVEIVREAREWRYKQLDHRLAELGDRAMQVYFDAGMPDDPAAVEALLKKVDAKAFLPDTLAILRSGGVIPAASRSRLEALLGAAQSSDSFSLFDSMKVLDALFDGRQPGAVRRVALDRFPWSLIVPSSRVHPKPVLNDQFSHHFIEPEILLRENYPGQDLVDAYRIDDIPGFAGHDFMHGEQMLSYTASGERAGPKNLKEALELEIVKARFLDYGRSHPSFLSSRPFDDDWFDNLHEYPGVGGWVLSWIKKLPPKRYVDIVRYSKAFGYNDHVDFESAIELLDLLSSPALAKRKRAVDFIKTHPQRTQILRSLDIKEELTKLVSETGEMGAAELLAEVANGDANAFLSQVTDLKKRQRAWSAIVKALHARATTDLKKRFVAIWMLWGLQSGCKVDDLALRKIVLEIPYDHAGGARQLLTEARDAAASKIEIDSCVRNRLIRTLPWAALGGGAAYGVWRLLLRDDSPDPAVPEPPGGAP